MYTIKNHRYASDKLNAAQTEKHAKSTHALRSLMKNTRKNKAGRKNTDDP